MVSKARDDLPLPESPVTTTITSRGRETVMSFRLCSRAPRTTIWLSEISAHPSFSARLQQVYGPRSGGQRTKLLFVRFYHPIRAERFRAWVCDSRGWGSKCTRRLHHVATGPRRDPEGLLPNPSRRARRGLSAAGRRQPAGAWAGGRRAGEGLDLLRRSSSHRPRVARRGVPGGYLLDGLSSRRLAHELPSASRDGRIGGGLGRRSVRAVAGGAASQAPRGLPGVRRAPTSLARRGTSASRECRWRVHARGSRRAHLRVAGALGGGRGSRGPLARQRRGRRLRGSHPTFDARRAKPACL